VQRLRGLQVDDRLEGGRLLDRQIGWRGALDNPADIDPWQYPFIGPRGDSTPGEHRLALLGPRPDTLGVVR
jgi:hypothetical protein